MIIQNKSSFLPVILLNLLISSNLQAMLNPKTAAPVEAATEEIEVMWHGFENQVLAQVERKATAAHAADPQKRAAFAHKTALLFKSLPADLQTNIHQFNRPFELLPAPKDSVANACMTTYEDATGLKLVQAKEHGWLVVWDLKNNREIMSINAHYGHASSALAVYEADDGWKIIEAYFDNLTIWDIATGKLVYRDYYKNVRKIKVYKDATGWKALVNIDRWGNVYLLDLQTYKVIHTFDGNNSEISTIHIYQDNAGFKALVGTENNSLHLYDLEKGTQLFSIQIDREKPITAIHTYQDKDGWKALSLSGGIALQWDLKQQKLIQQFNLHYVETVYQDATGWKAIVYNHDQKAHYVCDLLSGKQLCRLENDNAVNYNNFTAYQDQHGWVVYAHTTRPIINQARTPLPRTGPTIKIWQLQSGKCLYTLGHLNEITCIDHCKNQESTMLIASAQYVTWENAALRIWGYAPGKAETAIAEEHTIHQAKLLVRQLEQECAPATTAGLERLIYEYATE